MMEKVIEYMKENPSYYIVFESQEEIDVAVSYFDEHGWTEDGAWSYKNLSLGADNSRNSIMLFEKKCLPDGWQVSAFISKYMNQHNGVKFKDIYNQQTFESEVKMIQYVIDNDIIIRCGNYEEFNCFIMLLERNGKNHVSGNIVSNDIDYYKIYAHLIGCVYVTVKMDNDFWLWTKNYKDQDMVRFEELYNMLK